MLGSVAQIKEASRQEEEEEEAEGAKLKALSSKMFRMYTYMYTQGGMNTAGDAKPA